MTNKLDEPKTAPAYCLAKFQVIVQRTKYPDRAQWTTLVEEIDLGHKVD